jgi:integrase
MMYQRIRPVLKPKTIGPTGTCLIYILYSLEAGKRITLSTEIYIPPEFWDVKARSITARLPKQYGCYRELQQKIHAFVHKAEDMVAYAETRKNVCPLNFLRRHFHKPDAEQRFKPILKSLGKPELYSEIDAYIRNKKKTVKLCSINVLTAMKQHLFLFEQHRKQPITFESFDAQFYDDFVYFLTYDIEQQRKKESIKGLKINTIGKTIKHMKSFLRDRMQKKIIPHFDISYYRVMEEEVDAVYLSWEELSKVYHLDLSNRKPLEKYRDLFVLGCLTGFRFSDYSNLRPEELRGGMLYVTQMKTLSTVVVPLRKDARDILVGKYSMKMPQVSNVNFNYYIKEIVKLAGIDELVKITHKHGNMISEEIKPKYAWIVSHTCRRSFCTNEFLAKTPVHLIMAISGHKTEKAFRRYVKADQLQKAFMIKEIWDKGPCL